MRFALIALIAVNVFDYVIHAASDELEPLRVTSNVVVVLAAIGIMAIPALRAWWVPALAGAIYLTLNLVFIALFSIGALGVALIVTTTVLCALIAVLASRCVQSK